MEERAGYFAFIVFFDAFHYGCPVALPHGAMGWSAVCDVVFPDHTHFDHTLIFIRYFNL